MGALSPRTRNAQAALYQSGEVDFLVATDAIGMGINLDVDHVAFASRSKFDGRRQRVLRPDEVAQIAGRAGRFRTDGTFGETGDCPPLDEETIARVVNHEFEPVVAVEWRNPHLDFSSLLSLQASLAAPPTEPGLMRVRGALDEETLRRLSLDSDITDRVRREADVRRLWDVCLTPDFRKVTPEEHTRLVGAMASILLGGRRIGEDWIAREVGKLDRTEGDLDVLQARLAHIRTWTYVANRADWIEHAPEWQAKTRAVEDKLSDALHGLLTQRFIDRRTSALLRGLRREDTMLAGVSKDGEVVVEGHFVGRLVGLDFKPDPRAIGLEERAVRHAAMKALSPEVERRLAALAAAEDADFALERDGVRFGGAAVARIARGAALLRPAVNLIGAQTAQPLSRRRAAARIEAWIADEIARELWPLVGLEGAGRDPDLSAAVKGLAYRLFESGGALDRREAPFLSRADRAALAKLGVQIGRHTIHAPTLFRPRARRLRASLAGGERFRPPRKALSAPMQNGAGWADYAATGFRPCGDRAVRIDAIERLAAIARKAVQGRDFPLDPAWAKLIGADPVVLGRVLKSLGYRRVANADAQGGAPERWRPPTLKPQRPPDQTDGQAGGAEGAFGGLASLIEARRAKGGEGG
jgi:ATP-dependent RNA helicase SUPV3L1/SUV3